MGSKFEIGEEFEFGKCILPDTTKPGETKVLAPIVWKVLCIDDNTNRLLIV